MNDKNIDFYNKLGVEPFQKLSKVGGFDSWVDLEIVYPFIDHASSIMELGAGYGRCLDFFLKKGFKGKLIAIEKAKSYLDHLNKVYAGKVEVLDADIKKLALDQKVDVILWMFSGIIDFSPEEQVACIKNLSKFLNPNGKLVVDVPRLGFKTYADHEDNQRLKFDSEYGLLECYIPSIEDMSRYMSEAGFSNFIRKDYMTATEKARTVYILEKKN